MIVRKQLVQVDGLPIHYEVAGEGEPLVLVHGLSESTRLWYRNLPAFAKQYRVYLIDLPGFGAMRKYHRQFKLIEAGAWLDGWMRAVGLETVNLIGHSMGGYISMAFAVLRPEKVRRLVLVDSIGIPFQLPVQQLRKQALRAILRTMPSFWWCIGSDYLRAGPAMIENAVQQIITLDAASVISAVNVPTFIIWGENDDLVPSSLGHQLHKRLKGSRLYTMPGANHFCMYERPQEFNNEVLLFLKNEKNS